MKKIVPVYSVLVILLSANLSLANEQVSILMSKKSNVDTSDISIESRYIPAWLRANTDGDIILSSYKGIQINLIEADLPPTLAKSYEGIHNGEYFRLMMLDGKILSFDVVCDGETFDKYAIVHTMTLAQAIREHSLSKTTEISIGLARGIDNVVWGIVDLKSGIAYTTGGSISPESSVITVSYLMNTAPVWETAKSEKLSIVETANLFRAATLAKPHKSSVRLIAPSVRYSYTSRDKALRAIGDQSDLVIGKARKTLSLMQSAEFWLNVDQSNSEAKKTFTELRKFHFEFRDELERLIFTYEFNKSKMQGKDITLLDNPKDLNEQIRSKLIQIKAMGYRE
jgi:hypothetical protein